MESKLINLGLSKKEARLYLLCLKVGETSANRLIELSGFPRGTVYNILEKLKSNGIITSFIANKTTHFIANDPDIFLKNLEERKTEAEKIIPMIRSVKNKIDKKMLIEIFEGLGGVKKLLDDVIKNAKECIIMGNEQKANEVILHHPLNFKSQRLENKIKIKNLIDNSEASRELKDDKFTEVRHLKNLLDTEVLMILYNDIVARVILTEPITIIKINSKQYSKDQRILFDLLWEQAEK